MLFFFLLLLPCFLATPLHGAVVPQSQSSVFRHSKLHERIIYGTIPRRMYTQVYRIWMQGLNLSFFVIFLLRLKFLIDPFNMSLKRMFFIMPNYWMKVFFWASFKVQSMYLFSNVLLVVLILPSVRLSLNIVFILFSKFCRFFFLCYKIVLFSFIYALQLLIYVFFKEMLFPFCLCSFLITYFYFVFLCTAIQIKNFFFNMTFFIRDYLEVTFLQSLLIYILFWCYVNKTNFNMCILRIFSCYM